MSRPRRVCSAFLGLALAGPLAAEEPPYAEHLGIPAERIRLVSARPPDDTRTGLDLVVDPEDYRRLWDRGSVVLEGFPLPGRPPVQLELSSFDVVAPGARFIAVDRSGEHVVPRPRMRSFRGKLSGDLDSLAVINLYDDRIAGFIRAHGEEFDLVPLRGSAPPGAPTVRVRAAGARPPDLGRCARPAPAATRPRPPARAAPPIDAETVLEARVAIDATVEWFAELGSLAAAQLHILNLVAEVSAIYESELNVRLAVPYLRVFTIEPDPYPDGEDWSGDLAPIFRAEWNANQTGVSRTVAHLFSARASGGNGYGYIDVLCENDLFPGDSYDYGVSVVAPGIEGETYLLAHELGHNFSSPHTHCYVPEVDKCFNLEPGCYEGSVQQVVGTIMSYCNQTLNVFGPRPIEEKLRPAAEAAYPTCVALAGKPAAIRPETDALVLGRVTSCPAEELRNDDGLADGAFAVAGMAQGAFLKRFTPACHPFQLEQIEFLVGESPSIAVGRPIRLLVYTDPTGSGNPALSTLVYTEDTAIQVKSQVAFNAYALASPVIVGQGDVYVGYQDLVADLQTTTMALRDSSVAGDSWRSVSPDPNAYAPLTNGTWMIRGHGGAVPSDSVELQWGDACNHGAVPDEDFAVYAGTIGDYAQYESRTCTTGGIGAYVDIGPSGSRFYIVVPLANTREGSYGKTSDGEERPAAALPCKLQEIDSCP